MKTKNGLIGILFVLMSSLSGCLPDALDPGERETRLMGLGPVVSGIDDGTVELSGFEVLFTDIYLPYDRILPDECDIYMAEDNPEAFEKLVELQRDKQETYKIRNLENGKAYFFYFVSRKEGYEPLTSATIMAVPNRKPDAEYLCAGGDGHSLQDVAFSPQQDKIAYVDVYYTWDDGKYGAEAIFISKPDGSGKELLDINASEPSWSPSGKQIAFRTEKAELTIDAYGRPSQIALYDCETKTITKLTKGSDFNYSPDFSENGEFLLFVSNKNADVEHIYDTNVWLMHLATLQTSRLTDSFYAGSPKWIDNDRFLFHAGERDKKSQLYESSVSGKEVRKVFDSPWNDYCPSASPDGKRIAFISDRSALSNVWIYDKVNGSYSQISVTSEAEHLLSSGWMNIEWLDNATIAYSLPDNSLVKVKIPL
jgi:TolB protein